jgi:hypothetical protein
LCLVGEDWRNCIWNVLFRFHHITVANLTTILSSFGGRQSHSVAQLLMEIPAASGFILVMLWSFMVMLAVAFCLGKKTFYTFV